MPTMGERASKAVHLARRPEMRVPRKKMKVFKSRAKTRPQSSAGAIEQVLFSEPQVQGFPGQVDVDEEEEAGHDNVGAKGSGSLTVVDPQQAKVGNEEPGREVNESRKGERKRISKDLSTNGPKRGRRKRKRAKGTRRELNEPSICVFCDDGGNHDLLGCEGVCRRYFHTGKNDKGDSPDCDTLGLPNDKVKALQKFICKNCEQKKHQCFSCGKLGSSDGEKPEVLMCEPKSCYKFYHPGCLSAINGYAEASGAGNTASPCPRHRCKGCGNGGLLPRELIQCRRCPEAWHEDCFNESKNSGQHSGIQIWNHVEENITFSFMYCGKHTILQDLNTPARDHIKFPDVVVNL